MFKVCFFLSIVVKLKDGIQNRKSVKKLREVVQFLAGEGRQPMENTRMKAVYGGWLFSCDVD